MAKKITSRYFAIKRTIEGTNTTVTFVPNVPTYRQPEIAESYVNDEMEVIHILVNGNELSESNYLKYWGKPKSLPSFAAKTERVNPNPFAVK